MVAQESDGVSELHRPCTEVRVCEVDLSLARVDALDGRKALVPEPRQQAARARAQFDDATLFQKVGQRLPIVLLVVRPGRTNVAVHTATTDRTGDVPIVPQKRLPEAGLRWSHLCQVVVFYVKRERHGRDLPAECGMQGSTA